MTRDGVEYWGDYGLELGWYVARQSLISAVNPADLALFDTSRIASEFQRRMAVNDIAGDLCETIIAARDTLGLILWDLTDERFGVNRVPAGGFVTRVVHYEDGVYQGDEPLERPTTLGASDHLALWKSAADVFLGRLEESRLLDRLIVNATPWALADENGEDPAGSPGTAPQRHNAAIKPCYEYLESRGVRLIRPPIERVVARVDHQWGRAPFHYVPDTYHAALELIAATQ